MLITNESVESVSKKFVRGLYSKPVASVSLMSATLPVIETELVPLRVICSEVTPPVSGVVTVSVPSVTLRVTVMGLMVDVNNTPLIVFGVSSKVFCSASGVMVGVISVRSSKRSSSICHGDR